MVLLSCYFYSNYKFLKKSGNYDGCDVIHHLTNKVEFHNKFVKVISEDISLKEKILHLFRLRHISRAWPPMLYFVSFFISSVFGGSTFVAELSNIFYVAILFFGVYFLGRRVANVNVGLLAALIVSSFSTVSSWSRLYGIDLPLMSLTPWAILLLLKTSGFTDTKSSILFGLFLGLVALFKLQISIFILCPLLYVLLVKEDNCAFRAPKPKQFINLIIALSFVAIISSVWLDYETFALNFAKLSNAITFKTWNHFHVSPCPVFSWSGFTYYLRESRIGPFYIIFLLFALVQGFLRKEDRYPRNILLLWVIFPYVFFTLMESKTGRWYFPSLPGIALLISLEVSRLRFLKARRFLIILILLFGLGQLIINDLSAQRFRSKEKMLTRNTMAILEKIHSYKKGAAKLAIYNFDGDQIICPFRPAITAPFIWQLNLEYKYNIKLYAPEDTLLNCSGTEDTEADFIILLLRCRDQDTLRLAGQLYALETNIMPEEELSKIFRKDQFGIEQSKLFLTGWPGIKKVIALLASDNNFKDCLVTPKIRRYYIALINQGKLTVEECAQKLKLPAGEIASWVDDYNRRGQSAIDAKYGHKIYALFPVYKEHYTKRLNEELVSLSKSFVVIGEINSIDKQDIFLLARKDIVDK